MPSQPPDLLCHYSYDPLDRLIHQIRPDMPTHRRFYCKNRLATEIQEAMQHSPLERAEVYPEPRLEEHSWTSWLLA